uniref:IBR domain-containing protein n=1 Tax=Lactuca sativa TaxID=4236 RepID=A0A9R1UFQ3_LACSA|nr:hypothetical protein LSAT_V11C900469540 [Lactuca sativa]
MEEAKSVGQLRNVWLTNLLVCCCEDDERLPVVDGYISTSINDEPGCLTLRSFVEDNRKIKWCPAPGCDYVVDFIVGGGTFDVTCGCSYSFCWNYRQKAPADLQQMQSTHLDLVQKKVLIFTNTIDTSFRLKLYLEQFGIKSAMLNAELPVNSRLHILEICLQLWLTVSLITDALVASGQALIASSVSKGDYRFVKDITYFVLIIGFVIGVTLAAIFGVSFGSIVTLFTKDIGVLVIARTEVLFMSASQPLNALAFNADGLHYGVSDFPYAAYSMMLVGILSSAFLFYICSLGFWSSWCLVRFDSLQI